MNLKQYLAWLMEQDPDVVVDALGISSEELVRKFHNKAAQKYYREEEEAEGESQDD